MKTARFLTFVFSITFLAIITCWLALAANSAINTNQAWWLTGAARWLDGGTPFSDFYDTNPPWVVWIYALQVLFAHAVFLPVYYVPAIFGMAGLGLSLWACNKALKALPGFSAEERFVFCGGFAIACTILSTPFYFADRDHLVIMALMPLLLTQLVITRRADINPVFAWAVTLAAGMILLVKPHYGIFPLLMVAHRAWARKDIGGLLKDPDFTGLALCVAIYLGCMMTVFADFPLRILPDSALLYIHAANPEIVKLVMAYGLMAGISMAAVPLLGFAAREVKILMTLFGASLLCVGFIYLQQKGFHYHAIPALAFFNTGAALTLFYLARRYFHMDARLAAAMICTVMAAGEWNVPPFNVAPMTHAAYKALPLPKMLEQCGPCSALVISETMDIVQESAVYAGKENASRFPGLWWIPQIALGERAGGDYKGLQLKYSGLAADDLERYRPDYIFVITNMMIEDIRDFNIMNFLSASPAFAKDMEDYKKIGAYRMNRGDYFKGSSLDYDYPLNFDVYERRGIAPDHLIAHTRFEHAAGVNAVTDGHHETGDDDFGRQHGQEFFQND